MTSNATPRAPKISDKVTLLDPVPQFFGKRLRVLVDELNGFVPWFVAMDVGKALDLVLSASVYRKLFDSEKSYEHRMLIGLKPGKPIVCVSESGFYKLIMRSNKPEAEALQHWVCSEVLPSIRRTGAYQAYADADTNEPIGVPDVMVDMVKLAHTLPSGNITEEKPRIHVWQYCDERALVNFDQQKRSALGKIARRLLLTHNLTPLKTWEIFRTVPNESSGGHTGNTGVYPEEILDLAMQEYLSGRRD